MTGKPVIPKIVFTSDNTREFKCECGNDRFHQPVKLRYASPVVSGKPNGQLVIIEQPKWVCSDCGKELDTKQFILSNKTMIKSS